ncbi:MAG: tyrosine-protein phosphatase [bacterium]
MTPGMMDALKQRLEAWQRRLTAKIGGDISTPEARRAAGWHYTLMDHGFLRVWWHNLHQVAPGVFRSNQPSGPQLTEWHRKLGLKTVLNLRGASNQSFHLFEAEACEALGIRLIDLPMAAAGAPRVLVVQQLIELFQTVEKPLLIHCKSGADRTGLAAALYQLVIEGKPIEEAKKQVSLKYLHVAHSVAGIQDHFLRTYEAAFRKTGIGFMDWLQTEYDPKALKASFLRWRAGDRDAM